MRKGSRAALEGATREQGGATREQGGATREQGGAAREHYGAVQGRSRWEPELAALYPAIAARVIYDVRSGSCCLEVSKFQLLR